MTSEPNQKIKTTQRCQYQSRTNDDVDFEITTVGYAASTFSHNLRTKRDGYKKKKVIFYSKKLCELYINDFVGKWQVQISISVFSHCPYVLDILQKLLSFFSVPA